MKLIIVESPTKAKTIQKFLPNDYKLYSSFGHIRDLPKSELGVDVENNFEPKYVIPTKARKTVTELKKLAKQADSVILASDEDREGEAIAWHLVKALNLEKKDSQRIVFHEITKPAILEALENPRKINQEMVNAQQARRILDRLVGYKLSPFLWKKVVKGLSAGRVQSVAVRLIVDREKERQAFKVEEYWSLEAELLSKKDTDLPVLAKLNKIEGKQLEKLHIKSEAEAKDIQEKLKEAKYVIKKIETKKTSKSSPKPFTTSSLQQTANRWLGFSAKQTMTVAQQLYEGLNLKGKGQTGLITYMRTDSLNLSASFIGSARDYIQNKIGQEFLPDQAKSFKTKSKGAQEAHEAIRPTSADLDPEEIKESLNPQQYKLYKLIWQRSLASQMKNAEALATSIDIEAQNTPYEFRSSGQIITFKGYLKIYPEKSQETQLPELEKGEALDLKSLEKKQHFTQPPARYSDAGLVKEMEKYGIGRPSTYSPTISTIIARNYVNRDESKRLFPTDIAFVVTDLLINHFPKIVNYQFTADMETSLDKISAGEKEWPQVIASFYTDFIENLEKKYEEIQKEEIMPEKESDETCDKCGSKMLIKTGRYGKFLACSNFPDCKNTMPLEKKSEKEQAEIDELQKEHAGETCDKCGADMVIKTGRYGKFLGCSNYPKCKSIKNIKDKNDPQADITCPLCQKGNIVKKFSRRGAFYGCSNYPECKNAYWGKPLEEKCPQCGSLLVESKKGVTCSDKGCGYIR
ncbi:MAG: type I DNA topoisomerase [Candidatus Pacebacteria bacterium]|nr:type I DNA topoisomerase [Candidatus Paceibacterota bacterium]